jgi:hypothetical protein
MENDMEIIIKLSTGKVIKLSKQELIELLGMVKNDPEYDPKVYCKTVTGTPYGCETESTDNYATSEKTD